MADLPIYGGAIKSDIVKRAYGMCGQAAYEFELSPEEMRAGVEALNDQMALYAVPQFNYRDAGDGDAGQESGLEQIDVLGAAVLTARVLAPQIGKTLALTRSHFMAESQFTAKYRITPQMELGRHTIRGAGNRWGRWRGPYFDTDASPSEIPQ